MIFILLAVLLGIFIYQKIIKPTKFWDEQNVPNDPAWPIVGNMGPVVFRKKHNMDLMIDLYNKYPDQRYVGMMQFLRPMLFIKDIELLKQMTVRDFDHFHDHSQLAKSDADICTSKNLFILTGQEWRQMRSTLSPVFTSSKMKSMYQLIAECAETFVGHFKGKEQVSVEMRDIFARFANDVIATAAFGVKVDSIKEPNNDFYLMGSRVTRTALQYMKMVVLAKFPFLTKIVKPQFFPTDVTNFFRSLIKDNITKREKEGIVRPDVIHLLMEARKGRLKRDFEDNKKEGFATTEESQIGQNSKQLELTDDDIVAQAILFFFAGFDTVSTACCFMAHELALHPETQERLQQEIDSVNQTHQGKIPYEVLQSMKYLDQVVCESLRLWTPGYQTERLCTKDYEIPPKKANERTLILRKGTSIMVPVMAIHRDPQYYPDPEKFDPERFSDENKHKIIPGTYMPFGVGPRNCIGSRFALLEMKTLFFHFLSKFDITVTNSTQIPIQLRKKAMNLGAENGFWLGLRPRKVSFY